MIVFLFLHTGQKLHKIKGSRKSVAAQNALHE